MPTDQKPENNNSHSHPSPDYFHIDRNQAITQLEVLGKSRQEESGGSGGREEFTSRHSRLSPNPLSVADSFLFSLSPRLSLSLLSFLCQEVV